MLQKGFASKVNIMKSATWLRGQIKICLLVCLIKQMYRNAFFSSNKICVCRVWTERDTMNTTKVSTCSSLALTIGESVVSNTRNSSSAISTHNFRRRFSKYVPALRLLADTISAVEFSSTASARARI